MIEQVSVHRITDVYAAKLNIDVSNHFRHVSGSLQYLGCGSCGLRWFYPLAPGDSGFYESLQPNPWYYQKEKSEFKFASKFIEPGGAVLEVGCAEGAFTRYIPAGIAYTGLEFNPKAAEKGRQNGIDIRMDTIESHAAHNAGTYQMVCHFQVLEHVSDPRAFLEACVNALKPGGKLVVGVPSEDSFLAIAEDNVLNMPPHHLTRWTDATLKRAMTDLSLVDLELWHEPITDVTRSWYLDVLGSYGLRKLFGGTNPLLSDGFLSRIYWRLAKVSALRRGLIRLGSTFQFAERGHTVCIVGTKPVVNQ